MPPLPPTPRIITYYQTHHDPSGKPISVLPLLTEPGIGLTHLILAAIHINQDPAALTLNDHPPSHPRFTTLWAELRVLQASGVKVLGMLGGAAPGTYARLDGDRAVFEAYYAPVRDLVRARRLDGLDLDVEEPMSLGGIVRLIDRLRADFGPAFIITLAPVAAALVTPARNLSGFAYGALEALRGREIAWYNAQFYCGWGDCSNTLMYGALMAMGWPARKVVVGVVTNPENGSGYVPWDVLASVIPALADRYPGFGGVMGWEYFNGLPGGRERPWEWAELMTALLRRMPLPVEAVAAKAGVLADEDEMGGDAPLPRSFEYHSDGLDGE
ncbi:chitinase [Phialemonium atrogriseum]|uniref:chitinase n=1 Tax=Phialemonium atrogriseum TaxID=1093897 RepID=A0AAJ0C7H8_9PEZI|nr:chitinase [Phialemonium atrogriseum]KAK1770418.1 chitinase [Phialemonium atrogriseum]